MSVGRGLIMPAHDRHAGQLGSVVADDHVLLVPLADDGGQLTCHPGTRE